MSDINPRSVEFQDYRSAVRELCASFGSEYWRAIEERQGRPDAAYQEFASAHAVLPDAQSAVIACLRTARTSGRADAIPRLLAEYARPRRQTPADPWWYFSMGVTGSERFLWLRRQAMGL